MGRGLLSPDEAIFLASLPHRQNFFRRGGWGSAPPPGDQAWDSFLSANFTAIDLVAAHAAVRDFRDRHEKNGPPFQVLTIWDGDYPPALRQIFDPPPVLFWSGSDVNWGDEFIAIVGTRDPAPITLAAVDEYVSLFRARRDRMVLVSGFARGTDGQAHRSAIDNEIPGLAVLGSGLFRAGPAVNRSLPRLAEKKGVPFTLVSEYAPQLPGFAANFPRRNRIIAGLASLVVVMQAPYKSGALITARFAADEGRDVAVFDHPFLAAPGFNEGARLLLESGAAPIELPSLPDRLLKEPAFQKSVSPEQLEFWKIKNRGELYNLGGGYFYRKYGVDK